jgi:hypothetical protein
MDERGRIDLEHTDRCSAMWGRDRLAPGVHRPFHRIAIVDQSLPMQCAAVFRRDALDLANFPLEVGTLYDLWLARQMARGGAGAYYVPERLASIRIHSESQSSLGRLENSQSGVYVHRMLLADPELRDVPRRPLQVKLAANHYGAAVCLIRDGRSRSARRYLIRSLALDRRPRAGLALAASFLPRALATRL